MAGVNELINFPTAALTFLVDGGKWSGLEVV